MYVASREVLTQIESAHFAILSKVFVLDAVCIFAVTMGPFPLYRVTIKPRVIFNADVTLGGDGIVCFV